MFLTSWNLEYFRTSQDIFGTIQDLVYFKEFLFVGRGCEMVLSGLEMLPNFARTLQSSCTMLVLAAYTAQTMSNYSDIYINTFSEKNLCILYMYTVSWKELCDFYFDYK